MATGFPDDDDKRDRAQAHRDRMARRSREQTAAVSDIGEIPPVVFPERRELCRLDLFRFLTTYFPASTGLSPFSDDHRRVIARLQECCLEGGRFIEAVYRGFAKTTLLENAAIWAELYGHRRFTAIFGGDAGAAEGNIDSIKRELSENDLLFEDFPEVCHPIRALEGKPQRCASQTYKGKLTHIEWRADTIVLPTIPGSAAGGGIVTTRGLTAGSRGMKHKRPDGTQQRPDLVLIDDPQTDESAASPVQNTKRLNVIRKSILKLGGHGKQLAVAMAATVIARDDLVDQLLDPKKNPAWQSERIKMVRRWADAHETLWLGEYARIRNTYDAYRIGDQKRAHAEATEFYRQRRAAMDAGAEVSWEHCYDHVAELSAIQHAYNALIDDGPEVFASEYQNEPLVEEDYVGELTIDAVAAKINGFERREVPIDAQWITAFVDVQAKVLPWGVVAWADEFTGYVLDYGMWPDLPLGPIRDVKRGYEPPEGRGGFEAALIAALTGVINAIVARDWIRDDETAMRVGQCLIDANWGKSTDLVHSFCRQTPHKAVVMPAHGRYVGASSIPFGEYKRKRGERVGLNWRIPEVRGKRVVRHVLYDTNWWKSFVHERAGIPLGGAGCLSLFKGTPLLHRPFAEQFTAEYRVKTEGRGRTVDEWKIRPGRADNHALDVITGCAVAASMLGVSMVGASAETGKPRKGRMKLSEIQRRRSA